MRINYTNLPILKRLEDEKLGEIGFIDDDIKNINPESLPEYINMIKYIFNSHVPFFKQNIYNLSQSFIDASMKAESQMTRDEIWNNIGEKYGTIIDLGGPFKGISACYYLKEGNKAGIHNYTILLFEKTSFLFVALSHQNNEDFYGIATETTKSTFFKLFPDALDRDFFYLIHNMIVLYINFIQYAEIETKILPPGIKERGIKCKYENTTNSVVTNINSTWFTNLVKSDAFKVSGHFRLQPCHDENGLPTKKLIWISDFMKSGYTSRARKLQLTK